MGSVGEDVFSYEEREDGSPVITIWRLQLDGI
jgi:hypothetical protein